jgi:hypothetical protein
VAAFPTELRGVIAISAHPQLRQRRSAHIHQNAFQGMIVFNIRIEGRAQSSGRPGQMEPPERRRRSFLQKFSFF